MTKADKVCKTMARWNDVTISDEAASLHTEVCLVVGVFINEPPRTIGPSRNFEKNELRGFHKSVPGLYGE